MDISSEREVNLLEVYRKELKTASSQKFSEGLFDDQKSELRNRLNRHRENIHQKISVYDKQIELCRPFASADIIRYHESESHIFKGILCFREFALAATIDNDLGKIISRPGKKREEALFQFEQSVRKQDNPTARFLKVETYLVKKTGDPDTINEAREQAIEELDQIIERFSDDEDVYLEARKRKDKLESQKNKADASNCFIATAVYSSYDAPEVLILREFRDQILVRSIFGRGFISSYYFTSPPIARWLEKSHRAKLIVRNYILNPLVATISKQFKSYLVKKEKT